MTQQQTTTLTDDARAVWLAVSRHSRPVHVAALDCEVRGLALLSALATLRVLGYILFSVETLMVAPLIPLYAADDQRVAGVVG